MRRVPVNVLLLVTLVSAVATFALVRRFFGEMAPVGWASVTLFVVAVVDVLMAVRVRAAVGHGGIGQDPSQLHPVTVARALALGQASALLGALATGVGAGLTLYMSVHHSDLAAARQELPASIAVLVGGLVLTGGGLFLEHSCSVPPGDDEATRLAEPT